VSKQWFAIRTKPNKEVIACAQLENQGFEVYLPLINTRIRHARKVSWQPRPFFAGYLFVHLGRDEQRWSSIRSTVGVLAPVRFGNFYPPVPNEAIKMLQSGHDEFGCVAVGESVESPFKEGERVRMINGSLQGFEGVFVEMRGEDRALVLLDWMQKAMRV